MMSGGLLALLAAMSPWNFVFDEYGSSLIQSSANEFDALNIAPSVVDANFVLYKAACLEYARFHECSKIAKKIA